MTSEWRPLLDQAGGTLHDRLLDALRRDIEEGTLVAGARMPAHRELARRMGIAIGTVTKAYAEAERLGLIASHVGRGTFVAGSPVASSDSAYEGVGPIDLTMNLPPLGPSAGRLSETLARLRRRPDIERYAQFAPHAGMEEHRRAAASWLAGKAGLAGADWRRLMVTAGAQQAMALAIDVLCRANDTILVEAVSFHGMQVLADLRGHRLAGVGMDGEGMIPDALGQRAAETRARLVYVQPSLQNPTARTMSLARRENIVRVARRHNLTILESAVYAPLANDGLPSLASLAPERTLHVASVSKALAPGLRAGYLTMPDDETYEEACRVMRAVCYAPCAFGPLIAAQWMQDGTADLVLGEIAGEATRRTTLARRVLGPAMEEPGSPASLHVWLPTENRMEAERLATRALRLGVALTPPAAPLPGDEAPPGLRLCLGAPSLPALDQALHIVAESLAPMAERPARSMV